MKNLYLKTETETLELFTAWEIVMMLIGVISLGILIFLSIIIYNYVHRFELDDELHR